MKKNYFSAFKKSAGFFPVIILGFMLAIVAYACFNNQIFAYVKQSESLVGVLLKRIAPATFITLAVVGLLGLKSTKVGLMDTFRFSNVLGVILSIVLLYVTKNAPSALALSIVAVAGGVSLIEIIIRCIGQKEVTERMGFNGYIGGIANSFNPICSGLIALAIMFVFLFLKDNTKIQDYVILYGSLAALVAVLASVIISINKSSFANFIDVLYFIGFEASALIILYSLVDRVPFVEAFIIVFLALAVSMLLRGFTFSGDYKSSKIKANRYFAQVFSSHSILLPVMIGIGLAGLFIYSTYLKPEFFYILNAFDIRKNPLNTTAATYLFSIVLMAACVALIIAVLALRNLKSPEIEKVDIVVSINSHVVLYGLPILYFAFKNTNGIKDNLIPFIAAIVFAVFVVFAVVTQLIRLKNYQGILLEDLIAQSDEKAEEPVEEPAEEAKAEEEVQEEVAEEPAEEAKEEAVEEEVIYVDEDGNEVEAPTEDEEVEEEVIYVDEDGNEISAEEAEKLEAQEEPVEEEATGEVVEETVEEAPAEEVQEAQPEETEEEAEDEAEDEEEDAEDEAEDEEEDAEEEEAPVEEKKSNVLVNDFEILDAEGKPKKIRNKFNSKLMYAQPETKDYYSEIKNYLVMYRCKGRFSARCETFRYKGLIAKVALGGKAIKVFLAIDPTSLEGSKYHYRDMSEKKQYAEVPTMIRVRSPRGLKYFKELVDLLMAARAVKPKRGFEPTDYTADLVPNGEAILGKLGLSRDVMGKPMTVSSLPEGIPDNIEDYIPAIQGEPLTEEEQQATVYLDTLCAHFVEGEEVTIDVLKSLHVVTAGNVIHVKARGAMDRSLKIYAEYFDADALKVLMATNCTAVKVIHGEPEAEEAQAE